MKSTLVLLFLSIGWVVESTSTFDGKCSCDEVKSLPARIRIKGPFPRRHYNRKLGLIARRRPWYKWNKYRPSFSRYHRPWWITAPTPSLSYVQPAVSLPQYTSFTNPQFPLYVPPPSTPPPVYYSASTSPSYNCPPSPPIPVPIATPPENHYSKLALLPSIKQYLISQPPPVLPAALPPIKQYLISQPPPVLPAGLPSIKQYLISQPPPVLPVPEPVPVAAPEPIPVVAPEPIPVAAPAPVPLVAPAQKTICFNVADSSPTIPALSDSLLYPSIVPPLTPPPSRPYVKPTIYKPPPGSSGPTIYFRPTPGPIHYSKIPSVISPDSETWSAYAKHLSRIIKQLPNQQATHSLYHSAVGYVPPSFYIPQPDCTPPIISPAMYPPPMIMSSMAYRTPYLRQLKPMADSDELFPALTQAYMPEPAPGTVFSDPFPALKPKIQEIYMPEPAPATVFSDPYPAPASVEISAHSPIITSDTVVVPAPVSPAINFHSAPLHDWDTPQILPSYLHLDQNDGYDHSIYSDTKIDPVYFQEDSTCTC